MCVHEEYGAYYDAYRCYQHIIENYPSFPRIADLLDHQYRIGNYFLLMSSEPLFGVPFLVKDNQKAVEIFEQVVKSAPYTDISAKAQYRLGYAYMKSKEYNDAITEFRVVLEKYPGTGYVDDALYSIGLCYFNLVQGPEYDQYSTEKALQSFYRYRDEYPQGRNIGDVFDKINVLNQYLAKSIYLIGYFYERLGYYEAALIYYDDLDEQYGGTFYALKARAKRNILEAMVKLELPYRELLHNYKEIISLLLFS